MVYGQWSLEECTALTGQQKKLIILQQFLKRIFIVILTFEMADDKHLHDTFQTVPVANP